MEDTGTPLDTTRVGFRDIYRAVGETETRIINALNTAIAPLNTASADHEQRLRSIELLLAKGTDHETRIRSIELGGSKEARDALIECEKLSIRMTAVELLTSTTSAREKGILATLSAGQKTVLLLVAIAGFVMAASDLINGFMR